MVNDDGLNKISTQLEEISNKLDEEFDDSESWKYISTGAVGGALQGGLQLIGFNFDQRGRLNSGDPIPGLNAIPVGLEWMIYFVVISMAGAVLGSIASTFIIGDITKKNITRVCVLSAAFGLFFPIAFDFTRAYLGNQVVIKNQEDVNNELSTQLFNLTQKVSSEPKLASTIEAEKEAALSYQSLIRYTSQPKTLENSRKNLLKIIENNRDIKGAVKSPMDLENKNLLLKR